MEKDYTKEPILINKKEPLYKLITIILYLMEKDLVVESSALDFGANYDNFKLNFRKSYCSYEINNTYQKDGTSNHVQIYIIDGRVKTINITYTINHNNYRIIGNIILGYKIDKITNKPVINNLNQLINKLIYFEENICKVIDSISPIMTTDNKIKISINEFYKTKKYIDIFNTNEHINKSYIDKFIRIIDRLKTAENKLHVGPVKILYSPHNKLIKLQLGGLHFIFEYNFKKFKYLHNHKFNMLLKILFETDLHIKCNSEISKQLLRAI